MNLLAHAFLSPSEPPGILIGNLTADWIKGRARKALPLEMRAGFALHRRIDAFTDIHPLVDHCAMLLSPRWHRYSPVLVDILFDHVLSCEWARYAGVQRTAFIGQTYGALREHLALLPQRAQYAAQALLADDWLTAYGTLDGISLSLTRLSSRLRHSGHDVELAPSVQDFLEHRAEFERAFHEFFPALQEHLALSTPVTHA